MILPPEHPLSMWDSLYKDYDNFLPKLVKKMNSNESIIDIYCKTNLGMNN